jgi:hypothetical protein
LPSPPLSLPSLSSLRLPSPSRTLLSSYPPPRCEVNLYCTDISPCAHNEGGVDSREDIKASDPNNDIPSKRRRLAGPLGGGPALSSHHVLPQPHLPPTIKARSTTSLDAALLTDTSPAVAGPVLSPLDPPARQQSNYLRLTTTTRSGKFAKS